MPGTVKSRPLEAVFFDVGETLVDETRMWERAADAAGIPRFALMGVLGGLRGVAGNTPDGAEELFREHVDIVGSSARWGVEKPEPEFFERMLAKAGCRPRGLAYVGDRVDNDVVPALAVGMVAVHVRRGPWGHLHEPPAEAIAVASLADVPTR